ncbi:MAG: class I SAM-dependent methyltransferase [Pirellulaceae bacterium]
MSRKPTRSGPPPDHTRPVCWEDDFSVNTLDESGFSLRPPINSWDDSHFQNRPNLIPNELLDGRSFRDFVERDHWPIPGDEDREGYCAGFDASYWMQGLADFLKVMRAARTLDIDARSVLDFGCASGRVVRHFCLQSDIPEVWGSDINRRHIRWLCQFMPPRLKPLFNSSMPSLALPDESMDIISAFSVFTHIDTFETSWLAELRRVLRPGGLCYLTVHNEDTWFAMRELDDSNRLIKSMLNTGRFSMDQLQHSMPADRLVYRFSQTGPYRSQVFHSNDYLQRVWGRYFDIQEIVPRYHSRQSVVLMTKPQIERSRLRHAA